MSLANIRSALDTIKSKAQGAYALVQGAPGDGAHHFTVGELESRDGPKPLVIDIDNIKFAPNIKAIMSTALSSGKSVVASGFERLDGPALKEFTSGMEKISEAGRYAVAVTKQSIEGLDLGNAVHARFDIAAQQAAALSSALASRLGARRDAATEASPAPAPAAPPAPPAPPAPKA